jgi:putative transposase
VPERITIDGSEANALVIRTYSEEHGIAMRIRQVKYLNNVIEQDPRAVEWGTRPMLGCKSFEAVQSTPASIELIPTLTKAQTVVEEGAEGLILVEQFYSLAA